MDDILKFSQFIKESMKKGIDPNYVIKENIQETPEDYVEEALTKIKHKIESFFKESEGEEEGQKPDERIGEKPPEKEKELLTMSQALKKGKEKEDAREGEVNKMSLKELNVHLESSELSTNSLNRSITIKFSDTDYLYNLFIAIPWEEGVPKDPNANFSSKDIEKCFIKFKVYDSREFELLGSISRTIEIKSIDEAFLINLKLELDKEYGNDEVEEFAIETK